MKTPDWKRLPHNPLLTTVHEARTFLEENREHGAICPACDGKVKVYLRALRGSMVASLIHIFQASWIRMATHAEVRWIDRAPAYLRARGCNATNDAALLRHWGLIEFQPGDRGDGSVRTGVWRITPLGVEFVCGTRGVHRYAILSNQECLGLDGPLVTVKDALGSRFDYRELMGAAAAEHVS